MTDLFHQSVRDLLYRAECVNTLVYDDVLSHQFFFKIVLQFRHKPIWQQSKAIPMYPPSPKSEDAHKGIKRPLKKIQKRLFFQLVTVWKFSGHQFLTDHQQDTHTFLETYISNLLGFLKWVLTWLTCQLTKALAEIGLLVNEDFGRNDISKGHKHLHEILVTKLLGQVVDEQVGAIRAWNAGASNPEMSYNT